MLETNWVKSAVANNNVEDTDPYVTVTVRDGNYVYYVYYDSITGKVIIKYLGKDEGDFILSDHLPDLKARYEKSVAKIIANAKHEGYGIEKLEIFYKGQKLEDMTIEKPKAEERFDVSKIGRGTYTIRATSNQKTPTGKDIYLEKDVLVKNVTDRLKVPSITLSPPEADGDNDWYVSPITITIDKGENNPLAKEIRYTMKKYNTAITPEEGAIYTEPITITEVGTYEIYAWVEDGEGWSSEETMPTDFQFDNVKPIIDTGSTKLTKGRTYKNPN
ncbi:MAG: hypothetical protein HFJ50_10375, partial [Clostridia bacterium]|nr:hypothetical protein [Clostridia bacterium]